eukprot:87815_1
MANCIPVAIFMSCALPFIILLGWQAIDTLKIRKNGICIKALITNKYIEEKDKKKPKRYYISLKYAVEFKDKYYLCEKSINIGENKYYEYKTEAVVDIFLHPSNRSQVILSMKRSFISDMIVVCFFLPLTATVSFCLYWGYAMFEIIGIIVSIAYGIILSFFCTIYCRYQCVYKDCKQSIITTNVYNSFINEMNAIANTVELTVDEEKPIEKRTLLLDIISHLPPSYDDVENMENDNN